MIMSRRLVRLVALATLSAVFAGVARGAQQRETITVYVLLTWKTDSRKEKPAKSGEYLYEWEAEEAGKEMVAQKRCKRYKVVSGTATVSGIDVPPPRRPTPPRQPPSVPTPGYHGSDIDRIEKHANDGQPGPAGDELDGIVPDFTRGADDSIQAANDYNDSAKSLSEQRGPMAARIEFMNNVVSLRKRDDFEKWAAERGDAEQRLGIVNADGSSFYRFYDADGNLVGSASYDSNGNLVDSVIEAEYDRLETEREAFEQKREELKTVREKLQERYGQIRDDYDRLSAAKRQIADLRRQREAERRRRQRWSRRTATDATAGEYRWRIEWDDGIRTGYFRTRAEAEAEIPTLRRLNPGQSMRAVRE